MRGERRGEERGSKQEVLATRRADGEKERRPVERIRQEWIREGVEFEINGGVFCRVA